MAPKRQRPSTPPPAKKKQKGKAAQPSIQSFFSSPSKPKLGNGIHVSETKKRDQSVISISDSDEEKTTPTKSVKGKKLSDGTDAAMAKRLAEEWASEDRMPGAIKGKARADPPLVIEEVDDIVAIDKLGGVKPKLEGVDGSSSSKLSTTSLRAPSTPEKKPNILKGSNGDAKVASVFAKPQPVSPPGSPLRSIQEDVKPNIKSSAGNTITSTIAEPVDAIDFDTDAFLFRPEEVDTSKWPKGRLPYSILVGVYVQVSGTRSRLLIVRVLTK